MAGEAPTEFRRPERPHQLAAVAGRGVGADAAAERRGDVPRASNVRDKEPEDYARRLYADGVARGWIGGQPMVDKWDDIEVEITS